MDDQANELRCLVSRTALPVKSASQAKLLVVAGGKGGVGATTIAANLAATLAQAGHRLVLVDADLDGGHVAMLCRLSERWTIADVLAGRRTVEEALAEGPAGVHLLAGAGELAALVEFPAAAQQRLIAQLQGLGELADLVVLDVGNSWNRWVRRFWHAADRILLVTTTEPSSIMGAYASIKVLMAGSTTVPVGLVVNRAASKSAAEDVQSRLERVCQRFLGFPLEAAGYLLDDPQVAAATQARELIATTAPACPIARQMERLALAAAGAAGVAAAGREFSAIR
jgi:flagellar biosynthesis protein FlhG